MKTLMGERIKTYIPGYLARLRGVISGVPIEMTMENMKKETKGGKIIDATRIKSKRDWELKDTMAVILQFENVMPENIQLGYMNYNNKSTSLNPSDVLLAKEWDTLQRIVKEKLGVQDVEAHMNLENVIKMLKSNVVTAEEIIVQLKEDVKYKMTPEKIK